MNFSKTTLNLIICFLILFSCALVHNYKKPVVDPINYTFQYDLTKPSPKEQIDSPILITSADFVKENNLDWLTNFYDFELNKSFEYDLKNLDHINEINSNFSSSHDRDLINIFKKSGITNINSKNSNLYNLTFEDRNNSSLVVVPRIELKTYMKRPIQSATSMGYYPDGLSQEELVFRDQLTSKIDLIMNIMFIEPLTEKLLYESKQKNNQVISSEVLNFFVDSGWKKAPDSLTAPYSIYSRIHSTNFQHLYSNFLSESYPKLLNNINSSIDNKLLKDLIAQANSIREQIIPKVSSVETSFKFVYPGQYKKSVNVSAAFLSETKESEQAQTTGDKIAEIYANFKSSLSKQINELFDIRGIKIFGEYKSIDDMVYMEKKEAYFVLGLDKDYALKTQNFKSKEMGPIRIETSDVNFKGDFVLTMIEPMSKQKLLNKKINVEETIKDSKRVVYSRNNENIVIADTNPEIVSKLLNKAYQNIMQELWTLLSPNNLKKVKSNVNEIRARLGFPAIPY